MILEKVGLLSLIPRLSNVSQRSVVWSPALAASVLGKDAEPQIAPDGGSSISLWVYEWMVITPDEQVASQPLPPVYDDVCNACVVKQFKQLIRLEKHYTVWMQSIYIYSDRQMHTYSLKPKEYI